MSGATNELPPNVTLQDACRVGAAPAPAAVTATATATTAATASEIRISMPFFGIEFSSS